MKTNFKYFDFFLATLTLILLSIGVAVVYSSTLGFGTYKFLIVQCVAIAISIIAAYFILKMDYNYFYSNYKVILGIAVLSLLLVLLIGQGKTETGSQSWFRFANNLIGLQPSEVSKVAFIITFSVHISRVHEKINNPKTLWLLIGHLGLYVGLVILQPDFGTALVFICIAASMMFVSGISYKYVFTTFILSVVSAPVIWIFLSGYQKKRIINFINPSFDPLGSGYQVFQSKIAIGSGQIIGNGLTNGIQTQMGYLPAKHTDFIYAVIGEELGFVGCCFVIIGLFLIIFKCFKISKLARDRFGQMICIGVGALFLAHSIENIGMCMGVMPLTGIPLPFISYGGSAIITNVIAVCLVLNVKMRHKLINFD